MKLDYTIPGTPRTKKNSQRILGFGKVCPVCKKRQKQFISPSAAYKAYEKSALKALAPAVKGEAITSPVNVRCLYYMPTRRKVDLCNLIEATCDILVAAKILADDNADIVVGHDGSRVLHDKANPRVEIVLEDAT